MDQFKGQPRLPKFAVPKRYDLKLKPDLVACRFAGSVAVNIDIVAATSFIVLNASELTVNNNSVSFTNRESSKVLKPSRVELFEDDEILVLEFPENVPIGLGVLAIQFEGTLNDKMKGFYRSKYEHNGEKKNMAVTQFEPADARRCFPCWDEPACKATFRITLDVPSDLVALSNMPIAEEKIDGNIKTVTYQESPVMSTYLVAVVVGLFDYVEDHTPDGVKVRVYSQVGKANQGKFALHVAVKTLGIYKDYFATPYTLPKLDMIAIPDFAAGAMENYGLVTYRETALLYDDQHSAAANKQRVATVVAHELAHQWFGNLVTMEWWTHLWLNEGFATWVSYLAADALFPEWKIWSQFIDERGPSNAVTSIASSPTILIAGGYGDGSIRIWDSDKGTCETTLNGHKGAVTALRYNKLGSLLASGSKDNDVILWDVVGEQGLFRLRGHRDQVTDVVFVGSGKKLVSSSKDKFLRVWDIDTQHCMQIVGGHHSEIWSLDVDPSERYLVTGSADKELRFYEIKHESVDRETVNSGEDSSIQNKWEVLRSFGEIQRQSKDRVATVQFNKSGNLLACQVAGKIVEIFRVLDDTEAKKKAKRRVHRKKEKKHAKEVTEGTENGDGNNDNTGDKSTVTGEPIETSNLTVTVSDVFKLLHTIRASKKICSISFCPITPKNSLASLALSLNSNLLEFYSIESGEAKKTLAIDLQGHRSDVRSVTLSSDNTFLLSTSHNAVKIWNPSTGSCLRTIDSGYGLCSLIHPTNKYGLVGTKDGTLEIIDIGSGTRLEVVEAHGGSLRSITPLPNKTGFVTGSADHDVKFWEYQIKQKPGQATKQLSVSNVRTMRMNDDVLVVAISPDAKYVAVALLDSTVKVHFVDTFKFFLSLYGHKLPVLCMDISSDGDLIVTGSADKNIKIWGLDFGDCHKSIFAHADSVMAVQFVPKTHYVFSVGKDRLVKYWDADKFELLLTLEGHHADIWCLAVSNRGDFIVTGSHDRSIRRWDRTEEQFFIEEEKEKRLEEMFEADLGNAFENKHILKEEIPEEGAVAVAGKKTQETLTATDSILERLDIAEAEEKRIAEHQEEAKNNNNTVFKANLFMNGLSPSDYVLSAFSDIHANDLEQTLLALPFSDALKLLSYLKEWTSYSDKVELVCRIGTLLLQTHYNQLLATPAARPVLTAFSDIFYERVKGWKDIFGFNLAAMDHIQQMMASRSDALFHDAKSKLLEIRARQSKRLQERSDTGEVMRKKKKKT